MQMTEKGGHRGLNTLTAPSSCSGSTFWCPLLAGSNRESESKVAHWCSPDTSTSQDIEKVEKGKDEWKISSHLSVEIFFLFKKNLLKYSK